MTEEELGEKCASWAERFRFYRNPPTKHKLRDWLKYFSQEDLGVAAKVLDHVIVVGDPEISHGYKQALESLEGWHPNPDERSGRWYFVGFGRPSESGPAMLRQFRQANNLAFARFDGLFHDLRDLPELKLTAYDHVVFVDDFSGTGRQVTKMWPRVAELVASEAHCYLVLTAVTTTAQEKLAEIPELRVVASMTLGPDDAVFHEDNRSFSNAERSIIEQYGQKADPYNPRGFGGLGVLFVLSHSTPNNCLPILHVDKPTWRGIFPRYLRAEAGGGTV